MKIERILSENDLLVMRMQQASRKKREGVLSEDAVTFEGKEQNREQTKQKNYAAYRPKRQGVEVTDTSDEAPKEDLDVLV